MNHYNENEESSSCDDVINRDDFQYSGDENHRFYQYHNGLRRTGRTENNLKGRIPVNASASIESPVGFFGDSVVSGSGSLNADNYFLDDIQEEEEDQK
jgi:hypothetical protein